jgi:hypothetical protein
MNPNLNRNECYLRLGKVMHTPVKENGERDVEGSFGSINLAKRRSRELMKQGKQIVTKP